MIYAVTDISQNLKNERKEWNNKKCEYKELEHKICKGS